MILCQGCYYRIHPSLPLTCNGVGVFLDDCQEPEFEILIELVRAMNPYLGYFLYHRLSSFVVVRTYYCRYCLVTPIGVVHAKNLYLSYQTHHLYLQRNDDVSACHYHCRV